MANLTCDIRLNSKLTPEQREKYQNIQTVQDILKSSKTIAIVGLSTESTKASNMVASYLQDEGFTIVPVHPKASEILGEKCYSSVADIPFPVDQSQYYQQDGQQWCQQQPGNYYSYSW